jgi:Ca2+-binding EF-hand superfamily protein
MTINSPNLQHIFDSFDKDADGKVSCDSFQLMFRAAGLYPRTDEIEDMKIDLESKNFDFNTFKYLIAKHGCYSNPIRDLSNALGIFDKSKTGKLEKSFLLKVLKGINLTDEQIQGFFKKVGSDNLIDYQILSKIILSPS